MDEGVTIELPERKGRGLHNWKNLFNKKPTLQDMIILFLLIITFVNVALYNRDIKASNDFCLENACDICVGIKMNESVDYCNLCALMSEMEDELNWTKKLNWTDELEGGG